MVPIPLSWQAEALLGGGGVYPNVGAGYGSESVFLIIGAVLATIGFC